MATKQKSITRKKKRPRARSRSLSLARATVRGERKKTRRYVYYFGDGHADGSGSMKPLLGGKGANLHEMTRIGLPVPPGFTLTTEVQDCVHHSGHGIARARPHRNEQRPLFIAKFLLHRFFNPLKRICNLSFQLGRIAAFVTVKVTANLGCQCEPWRHRQTNARHLVEVCSLAAKERL